MFDLKILTFIIPACNSAAVLKHCIDSMLVPQILDQLEILIINSGSMDATANVARDYCKQYPGTVRLISQGNRGRGGAVNTGCAAAAGKYLKVVDADAWVRTEHLCDYLAFLENCDADVVLTHHRSVDARKNRYKHWKTYPASFDKVCTLDEILMNRKDFDRCMNLYGITYRRDFYREKGLSLSENILYGEHEFAACPCCYAQSVALCDLYLHEYQVGQVTRRVADEDQRRHISDTGTVIRRLIAQQQSLPEGAGREYLAGKLQALVEGYLKIVLLAQPDRINGRLAAKALMERCKGEAPRTYEITKKKYWALLVLNRLHISKGLLDWVMDTRFYQWLRGEHNYKE